MVGAGEGDRRRQVNPAALAMCEAGSLPLPAWQRQASAAVALQQLRCQSLHVQREFPQVVGWADVSASNAELAQPMICMWHVSGV
jgi:hypothetical protein